MKRLPRAFFQRDPRTCAKELIGCTLRVGACEGTIVETEAYGAVGDEACHTFFRPSAQAFLETHPAGAAYVYLNYGMYWLLNVVIKGVRSPEDEGFVLLRAVEPKKSLAQMRQRRKQDALRALCSGPGKLTQAFGVTGRDHGGDFCAGRISLYASESSVEVETCLRVGITKSAHLPWRYLLKGSSFVSVKKKS